MKQLLRGLLGFATVIGLALAVMWLVRAAPGHQPVAQATSQQAAEAEATIPLATEVVTTSLEVSTHPKPSPTPQLNFDKLKVEKVEEIPTGPYRVIHWSPDGLKALIGKSITDPYYLTQGERSSMITHLTDLWLLDLQTGKERQLVDRISSMVWSPDSNKAAYLTPTEAEGIAGALYVLDLTTGETKQIAQVDFLGGEYTPYWLPTDEIIFVRDGQLRAIRPDGSAEREFGLKFQSRIGSEAGKPIYMTDYNAPVGYRFSPTGQRMAYLTRHSDERAHSVLLWLADIEGSNATLITDQAEGGYYEWSPDGEWLAFNTLGDTNDPKMDYEPGEINELWVVKTDSLAMQRLYRVDNWRWIISPTWSPDSKLIAFIEQKFSEESVDKNRDIWLADVVTNRTRKFYPANKQVNNILSVWWSPDGAFLYVERDIDVSLSTYVSSRLKLTTP